MTLPTPPEQVSGADLLLGYGDYLRFKQLVKDHCGLHFPEKRRAELEQGVQRAFAASMCADLDAYYELLRDPHVGTAAMEQLINVLTICESHFFRDAAQMDALQDHVLPTIIERRRPLRTLRVWSAGCASGEEPYSIAMLLHDLLPDLDEWSITIMGTDINTEALDRARQAVYSKWAFREQRARLWRSRYFRPHDKRYKLSPHIQRLVSFKRFNLAADEFPSYATNTMFLDLILCRNVTIYFDEPETRHIINGLYESLVEGGWLVVGHAEHSLVTYRRFQIRNFPGAVLYRRPRPSTTPFPSPPQPASTAAEDTARPLPVEHESPAVHQERPVTGPLTLKAGVPEGSDPAEKAREFLSYGHSEEARDLLLEYLKREPHDETACTLLAQAYANLGKWKEAACLCRRAIAENNLAMDAYYILALVLQHQGELEAAIEAMKKVIYIDRKYVLGHFSLADLYKSHHQLPRALKSLNNALRLLEDYAAEDLVPGSGGITADRLRQAIVRKQQMWSME